MHSAIPKNRSGLTQLGIRKNPDVIYPYWYGLDMSYQKKDMTYRALYIHWFRRYPNAIGNSSFISKTILGSIFFVIC